MPNGRAGVASGRINHEHNVRGSLDKLPSLQNSNPTTALSFYMKPMESITTRRQSHEINVFKSTPNLPQAVAQ